ncbi:MAG: hypothetical protein AAFY48_18795 [Bacteroidota bacterium]
MKNLKEFKKLALKKEIIVNFNKASEIKGGAALGGDTGTCDSSDCFTCECSPFETMSGCNSAGCDDC